MFAPKVPKPQTKAAAHSTNKPAPERSVFATRPFGGGVVEQAHFFQSTMGNQAALRLLSQRGFSSTREQNGGDHDQEDTPENTTAREAKPGISWDFSKIPVFPPDRASRPRPSSPITSLPLSGAIQAKIVVGEINDPLEHEANRVADQVMRVPDPEFSVTAASPQLSRKCAVCEEEAKMLQPKRAGEPEMAATEAPAIVHEVLRAPGQPLDAGTRAFFEPRFGFNFDQVRVHTDEQAVRSARAIEASAYTVGQAMAIRQDALAPANPAGQRLLAHELAHVVQQAGNNAAILQRQPVQGPHLPESTGDPTRRRLLPDERTRIDRFLQEHQVVLRLREKSAWLDGQRTSVQQVIGRVRREAQILLPDDDVIAKYIDDQFYRYFPAAGAPAATETAGPEPRSTLLLPGIPAPFGLDRGGLRLSPQLSPADASRIQTNLAAHGFAVGPGLVPVFDGRPSSIDQIIELSRTLVLPIVPREQIAGVVRTEWSRLVLQALRVPLPPPPPIIIPLSSLPLPSAPAQRPDKLQSSVGWQGTWHLVRSGPAEHTIQLQLAQGDGPIQRVYQFQVNATTGDVQAMVGAQAQSPDVTLVDTQLFDAIHTVVKASAFVQLVGGITNAGGTSASGSLTVQLQAGVQVTATLGPINVTVQAGPTLTLQQGQAPGLDFNPAVQGGGAQLPPGEFPPFHGIPLIRGTF